VLPPDQPSLLSLPATWTTASLGKKRILSFLRKLPTELRPQPFLPPHFSSSSRHLVINPNHKLQSGEAYNYDLLLNGIFNAINGMLGLPWLVATTVPCIIHLNALAAKDKDGRFQYVQETRWTGFLAHTIMLCCIFALSVLKMIPVPVLLGVFLFMGISSLPGIQFWQRLLQFIRQPSLYDETPYNKYMTKWRVHKYTLFQLLFFGGVFVVQNIKAISIGFPFMTLLCIPGRLFLLPRFFEGWELTLLDGEDTQIDEWVSAKEARRKSILFGAADDDSDSEDYGRPASDNTSVAHAHNGVEEIELEP
jgi:hypothetical protein